ncbi:MAG: hypothetical protein NZ937_09340 [Armatimonadetes bacterium]|nr:hypothetical protein [Armatimonadota bacterium]
MHGFFTISDYAFSPDGKIVAFGFANFIWLYDLSRPERLLRKIPVVKRPIELCWSPDGKSLLYVISESNEPLEPSSAQTGLPHSLHWVDKEGKEDLITLREEKGIRNLQWLKGQDVFCISRGNLWKVTLCL